MRVIYSSTQDLNEDAFYDCLRLLPPGMRSYIERYRNPNDQKQRLLARLLLRQCLIQTTGTDELLNAWRTDNKNKPYISNWYPFNISHAGNYVVLGYDEAAIGIDIEEHVPLDYTSMSDYFHLAEKHFIENSANQQLDFYTIWTKKEAMLKALGTGLVSGLQEFSCLSESIDFEGKTWFFSPLTIDPAYTCYVCSPTRGHALAVEKFTLPAC
ncbi:4'-phosphopantetheinyl transferase family protein [Hymenobacter sp. CRA2]|uniref:4'-phosphopantetheinyl transferase family protein n=1 Tax=Hymenobacter sp. CRA2 TaxID=1955620 RepID=UPI0009D0E6E0|nr:4'-phosphopantetheinyl transferase superfamily protein [Hymenobacter sp. CRA2]OON70555.1 hypothetical protein B0919_00575 [Hymenobacter sp. CRA2]